VTTAHARPRAAILSLLALSAGLGLSAPARADATDPYYTAAVAEAKKLTEGVKLGDSLEYVGQNSGAEGQTLEKVYAAFQDATGVKVKYQGTPDLIAIVQSRMQAGNPPDVVDLQLGMAKDLAAKGKLDDLSAAFDADLKANFSPMLLDTSSYDGKVFGIYQGVNPFMVWYNPQVYKGPDHPKDWQALVDYTDAEAKAGRTVWCAAEGAGASSGFPGMQMVEAIFLKKYGPELYQQWGSGALPWTSDQVKDAYKEFGDVIVANGHVNGGTIGALSTSIATGYNPLTAEKPGCQLAMWGAWVPGLIGETAKPGENIDFFRIPASDPKYYNYEMFQSAIAVGLTDNPTTLAFMRFIASTPAQAYLASLNRWPVANKNVAPDTYPSPLLQKITKEFFSGADDVEFAAGPNVMNKGATSSEAYKSVVSFMQSPKSLDKALEKVGATLK